MRTTLGLLVIGVTLGMVWWCLRLHRGRRSWMPVRGRVTSTDHSGSACALIVEITSRDGTSRQGRVPINVEARVPSGTMVTLFHPPGRPDDLHLDGSNENWRNAVFLAGLALAQLLLLVLI